MLLGREIGFTLTLAGIAGFIVSLGVTADSFVIFFERLKDEIRRAQPAQRGATGLGPGPADDHLGERVSILAAAVLYMLGVGSVKGFAFALGLATLLDLLIVFLFRHPIVTMFARTRAFLSPRVSGLGGSLDMQRRRRLRPATRDASRTKES